MPPRRATTRSDAIGHTVRLPLRSKRRRHRGRIKARSLSRSMARRSIPSRSCTRPDMRPRVSGWRFSTRLSRQVTGVLRFWKSSPKPGTPTLRVTRWRSFWASPTWGPVRFWIFNSVASLARRYGACGRSATNCAGCPRSNERIEPEHPTISHGHTWHCAGRRRGWRRSARSSGLRSDRSRCRRGAAEVLGGAVAFDLARLTACCRVIDEFLFDIETGAHRGA